MKIETLTPQIAAMYLGQKCDAVWVTGSLKGHIVKTGDNQGITPTMVSLMYPDQIANQLEIAPHLRRLESMTESEARELYEIAHGEAWTYSPHDSEPCLSGWWEKTVMGTLRQSTFSIGSPAVWLYLLSKGFDLLGLIDAGLAKEITN